MKSGRTKEIEFGGPHNTAVSPLQSGRYIENGSQTQDLTWIRVLQGKSRNRRVFRPVAGAHAP
jgi:hypothetical protein